MSSRLYQLLDYFSGSRSKPPPVVKTGLLVRIFHKREMEQQVQALNAHLNKEAEARTIASDVRLDTATYGEFVKGIKQGLCEIESLKYLRSIFRGGFLDQYLLPTLRDALVLCFLQAVKKIEDEKLLSGEYMPSSNAEMLRHPDYLLGSNRPYGPDGMHYTISGRFLRLELQPIPLSEIKGEIDKVSPYELGIRVAQKAVMRMIETGVAETSAIHRLESSGLIKDFLQGATGIPAILLGLAYDLLQGHLQPEDLSCNYRQTLMKLCGYHQYTGYQEFMPFLLAAVQEVRHRLNLPLVDFYAIADPKVISTFLLPENFSSPRALQGRTSLPLLPN